MNLTASDVRKLASEPSAKARGMLAAKIASGYRLGHFTAAEEAIAADIFRLLLKDVEGRIRQSLAEELAHCPNAPRDVVLRLAHDDTEVAAPVLEYSSVLSEDDLIAIVQSTREAVRLCAIARRETVSEPLSASLLDTQEASVLRDLLSNKGAALGEQNLLRSWGSIVSNTSLLEALVHRGGLPLTVAEKMFHCVSDEMKRYLSSRYKLSAPIFNTAANSAREWQLLGITPAEGKSLSEDELVEDLVDDLYSKGRLTHSLLIRALCIGNLAVFETGVARLARLPRINARILLMDGSGMGLEAIYKAAALPEGFLEAVKVLLRLSLEETQFGRVHRDDFRKRIIERIHIGRYHQTVENMQYLLSIIGGKILASSDAA